MKKAIIGYGGHAREVEAHISDYITFFVDDEYCTEYHPQLFPLSTFDPLEYKVMVAISDPGYRKLVVERLPKNTIYFNYIDPSAIILGNVDIGEGSFIGANCVLTTNIQLGPHAILNRSVNIGHDCSIDAYFSAMAGSVVSGDVTIGKCFYMGNNSSIKEKIIIGDNIKIGMNAAVVKDITQSGTYVGVPVKKI
jgi:sugar O-acyltransferase (sialic acid O-acetyltransferase NeuD family)